MENHKSLSIAERRRADEAIDERAAMISELFTDLKTGLSAFSRAWPCFCEADILELRGDPSYRISECELQKLFREIRGFEEALEHLSNCYENERQRVRVPSRRTANWAGDN